jgi:hypothetical protein
VNTNGALKYRSRRSAERVAFSGKNLAVVLGDDGRHWVVSCADAQRLEAAGYSVSYLPGR